MESQIVAILKEEQGGMVLADLTPKYRISRAIYFHCRSKYGGVSANELKRMHADPVDVGDSADVACDADLSCWARGVFAGFSRM